MELKVQVRNQMENFCSNQQFKQCVQEYRFISSIEMQTMFAGILIQFIARAKFNHLQGNKTTIIKQSVAGIAVQMARFKSKAIKFSREFSPLDQTKARFKINERTHSLSINSNQTSGCLHGNKSLQCSSTLVHGFREFKPFRENLDITMHRYELPIGNNSFDKKLTLITQCECWGK